MPRHSRSLFAIVGAGVMLVLVAGAAGAANVEAIYLGGMKVMTLRDQGSYPSLTARAVAVDKAITEVLSTQDSQHPVVTVKQLQGLWTVYSGSVPVVSVYPADAAANRMDPKTQALSWAKTLGQALPRATPCSLLPSSAFGPAAGGTSPVKPAPVTPAPVKPTPVTPAPVKPAPVAPSEDAAPAPKPVTPAPVAPAPVTPAAPVIPASAGVSAPVLIVQDAFATVRALPEDEYSSQRAELVAHLISDLTPFITGKVPAMAGAPAGVAPVAPVVSITPAPTKPAPTAPVVVKPAPVKPTPAKPTVVKPAPVKPTAVKPAPVKPAPVKPAPVKPAPVKPAPVKPAPVKPAPVKPAAPTVAPAVPADNPAYAKVPQKMRIREKLEQAREPFMALRQSNPELAAQVGDLLASCRNSFALGKFDESEGFVDAALRLMGPQ